MSDINKTKQKKILSMKTKQEKPICNNNNIIIRATTTKLQKLNFIYLSNFHLLILFLSLSCWKREKYRASEKKAVLVELDRIEIFSLQE
jgi:hypothetical protein